MEEVGREAPSLFGMFPYRMGRLDPPPARQSQDQFIQNQTSGGILDLCTDWCQFGGTRPILGSAPAEPLVGSKFDTVVAGGQFERLYIGVGGP